MIQVLRNALAHQAQAAAVSFHDPDVGAAVEAGNGGRGAGVGETLEDDRVVELRCTWEHGRLARIRFGDSGVGSVAAAADREGRGQGERPRSAKDLARGEPPRGVRRRQGRPDRRSAPVAGETPAFPEVGSFLGTGCYPVGSVAGVSFSAGVPVIEPGPMFSSNEPSS